MRETIPSGVINSFRGEYYFLSNYYTAPFMWRGIEFQSGEQAFAYAKCLFGQYMNKENADYRTAILAATSPGEAKKLGRKVPIHVDEWDSNKVQYMRYIVHAKFGGVPGLAGKLINTGAKLLVEGNDWQDGFWGRYLDKSTGRWVGLNTLGTILMEERGYWLYSDFTDKEK